MWKHVIVETTCLKQSQKDADERKLVRNIDENSRRKEWENMLHEPPFNVKPQIRIPFIFLDPVVKIFADPYHTKVSVISRLVPSPDWFVGLSGLELCKGGKWIEESVEDLGPYDAGTDRGFTFTAPNWPENPPKPISKITSQFPDHPANGFYYPDLDKLPTIARIYIKRVALISDDPEEETSGNDINSNEHKPAYKPILPVYNNEEVPEPSLSHKHHKATPKGPRRKTFASLFGKKVRKIRYRTRTTTTEEPEPTTTTESPVPTEIVQNEQPAVKNPRKIGRAHV